MRFVVLFHKVGLIAGRTGRTAALVFAVVLWGCGASGQAGDIRVDVVVSGLAHPWAMAFLPDGQVLVSERPGRLRLVKNGRLLTESVTGLPDVAAAGQGGLLDLALHPDFANQPWVYWSYAHGNEAGLTTRVARGRWQQGALTQVEVLFEALPRSATRHHFGSRLVFDRAGYLFITVGDRGEMARAQRLDDHAGSVIRLLDDGRVPADNPFVGQEGARPEIYSYGHRNPQGMTLHPETGEVWLHEHGPRGGDEVNRILPGRNYGWPKVTFGIDYSGAEISEHSELPGLEPPLHHWTPSIAPSGMAFHNGDLFVGALAGKHLARLRVEGYNVTPVERLLEHRGARIRDVRRGPDGALWILTDADNGELLKLDPASLN